MVDKKVLAFSLISFLLCSKVSGQQLDARHVLAKYIVAYQELKIAIEYEQRIEQRTSSEADLWRVPKIGDVDASYEVESYMDTLLGMTVYIVYPFSMHSRPYVLGIDDSLSIVRLAGFDERIHGSTDTSAFKSYNDPILIRDFSLNNISQDKVDSFVVKMISILETGLGGMSLINNTYQVVSDAIEGEAILQVPATVGASRWKYRIPRNGYLYFAPLDGIGSSK